MQMTWLNKRHRIKGLAKRRAWIVWTHGPPDHDCARALKEGVITVMIETSAMHLDRQIAIQGARSSAFYNASQRLHLSASSRIGRLQHNQNGPRWTVSS